MGPNRFRVWSNLRDQALTSYAELLLRKPPNVGAGSMWDLGAQGGNAKAPARNNAPGGSTARATRARPPKHAKHS